jgi:tripeptide aminopeptidase
MSRLLERFCRYVRVNTQAIDGSPTYPSSPGQWELGKILVAELLEMGISDATQDEHGVVMATIPARGQPDAPVIAWFAHLDTSPETSGQNVKPIIHRHYDGQDIVLPGDPHQVLRVDEHPDLAARHGHTIITSDGTTLLGADDKAGVAVIMETVQRLLDDPEVRHGPIRICFTCDEEIGRGVDFIDLKKLGAQVGYTLDGAGVGEIETETFSADKATVTITGINIHPSIAKGRMVNAIRLAALFVDRLPRQWLSPETTEQRQGFLHPISIEGGVGQTTIRLLLRDHDTQKLREQADLLRAISRTIEAEYPRARIHIDIEPQYRNMAEGLKREPRAVRLAERAVRRIGLTPKFPVLRGGTDGARLTELGLPTPNLSTGEHNPHSPLEWTSLEDMESAVRMLIELARLWGEEGWSNRRDG